MAEGSGKHERRLRPLGPKVLDRARLQIKKSEYQVCLNELLDADGELQKKFHRTRNKAWYLVGECFFQLAIFENALDAFRRAFHVEPGDAACLHAMGNCYSAIGKHYEAFACFVVASELNYNKDEMNYNSGNALLDLGDYKGAIDKYKLVDDESGAIRKIAKRNMNKARLLLEQQR